MICFYNKSHIILALLVALVISAGCSTTGGGGGGGSGGSGGGGGGDDDSSSDDGSSSSDDGSESEPEPEPQVGRESAWQIEAMNVHYARTDYDIDGQDVKVAIVDSGVDVDHKAFEEIDFDEANSWGYEEGEPGTDSMGHGSAVASLALSPQVGVAPGATLVDYALDPAGDEQLAGPEFALERLAEDEHAVDVANLSATTSGLEGHIDDLVEHQDTLVTISAGNSLDGDPAEDAAGEVDQWDGKVLTVGGIDEEGEAYFSTPKEDTGDDYFVSAPGIGTEVAESEDSDRDWSFKSGTSMAAPLVAGVAALARERWPYLSAEEIGNLIVDTADQDLEDFEASYDPSEHGQGIVDAEAVLVASNVENLSTSVLPQSAQLETGRQEGEALVETQLRVPASMGDAFEQTEALQQAVALDQYKRSVPVDLSVAVTPQDLHSEGERLSRLLNNHSGTTFAAGETPMPGIEHELLRYTLAEARGTTPAPFADRPQPGPAMALLGNHSVAGEFASDGRAHAAGLSAPLSERWQLQAEMLHYQLPAASHASEARNTTGARMALRHETGKRRLQLALSHAERPDAWGMQGTGALAPGRGDYEQTLELAGERRIGQSWHLFAQGNVHHLQLQTPGENSLIRSFDGLFSASGRLGIEHRGEQSVLGLAAGWPDRIEHGHAKLRVPTGVTLNREIRYTETQTDLEPSGRTREIEAYGAYALPEGQLFGHLLMREEPGHRADAPSDWMVVSGWKQRF